jgi:tRNA pseudouridine38-40 synthase
MFNYNLIIEYEGTHFVGWQKQKKGKSIQHEVEKALRKIFKAKINLVGSGRTDAGVHALGQSAHFIVKNKIENYYKVKNSLNYFLSKKKIVIIDIKLKSESFHARFDAVERVYEYKIINRDAPLCLDKNRAWHIKKNLDLVKIKKGLKIFPHLEHLVAKQNLL